MAATSDKTSPSTNDGIATLQANDINGLATLATLLVTLTARVEGLATGINDLRTQVDDQQKRLNNLTTLSTNMTRRTDTLEKQIKSLTKRIDNRILTDDQLTNLARTLKLHLTKRKELIPNAGPPRNPL
jgi:peptidoglycan hydrolase CwlO-like protein